MDRHDFTNKYNTPIPAELQKQYENYLGKLEAPLRSSYDYDIQGAFLMVLKQEKTITSPINLRNQTTQHLAIRAFTTMQMVM